MNYAKYIVSLLIFGSIGIFVKNINLPSTQIVMYRTIIATLFFILLFSLPKNKIDFKGIKNNLLMLVLSGISLGTTWAFLFESYARISISIATLLYYFAPTLVILLSPLFLKEKLTSLKIICISISVIGMTLISNIDIFNIIANIGIVYGFLSALFYAFLIIFNKKIKVVDGSSSTFIQIFVAMIIMICYVFIINGDSLILPDKKSIILTLIVGFIHTGFACLLYFSSLPKLPTTNIAFLGYIDPISALIFANIFLDEKLGLIQIIGAFLIIGSALLNSSKDFLKKQNKHRL